MKTLSLTLGLCLVSGLAFADDELTPRAEVGFNYTYLHLATPGSTDVNNHGGSAYVEYNLNRVVGLVADFGAYANGRATAAANSGTTFTYLFGPRFNWRISRMVPYVQFLFGGADAGLNGAAGLRSRNGFATSTGGGFDFVLSRHIALKPIQVEYLTAHLPNCASTPNTFQNDLRYSGGVVFRFGQK